ncbi:MAG: UDP-N-acetylglucosamine 1-carboxyvinyltransferase [Oscillospiraceae bacterium]|nr:UDP-N-acetylglucosamine 1-carboxyvinyltransferase [Oscillospiraceae bacterium]
MDKYVIKGGTQLHGEVEISGAKNAAVAIIPAALMVNGVCRIENIPQISDTDMLLSILTHLGASVDYINPTTIEIDCTAVRFQDAPFDLTRKIRASYYLIGAMLGRFGTAKTTMPGGCNFGVRPIEQHIKGMTALGAKVDVKNGFVYADAPEGRLRGARIYLDKVSVGATMNIILAATLATGRTIIENAAREPHIVDLANFLNSMGADIRGAGTDTVKINGVEKLHGGSYSIIPDQIEAGTYMVAAAATGGEVLVKNVIPKHLECISAKLRETGTIVQEYEDSVLVKGASTLRRANIKTLPYPGFPTDMQPQMGALLCMANGTSIITEGIYDNRFKYINELRKMGAEIQVDGRVAVVEGNSKLTGAVVQACDLRAGAAMVIAGMCASGVTEVEDVHFIERGYENFVGKLSALGADIQVVSIPEEAEGAPRIIYVG